LRVREHQKGAPQRPAWPSVASAIAAEDGAVTGQVMDSNPSLQPPDARHGQQQQGRSRLNPVAHRVRVTQEARAGFPFLGSECCAGAEPQAGVGGKGRNRVFGSWRVVFAIWGVCVLAACSSEFPVEWRLGSRVGIKAPMVRTGFLGFGSLMLWLYCKDRT
jgi:hypothetical protein